jgi:2-dehydro-3-deoxy-D-arabinonate dehydratase
LANTTRIAIAIDRAGGTVFAAETTLAKLKRDPLTLVDYLNRELEFPQGTLLMTGTGVVPGDEFKLAVGDVISIRIDRIGELKNEVA